MQLLVLKWVDPNSSYGLLKLVAKACQVMCSVHVRLMFAQEIHVSLNRYNLSSDGRISIIS